MSIKFGKSPKTCLGTKVSAHFMVLGLDGSIRMAILISQSSYGSSLMFQTLLIAFFTLKFLSIKKPRGYAGLAAPASLGTGDQHSP